MVLLIKQTFAVICNGSGLLFMERVQCLTLQILCQVICNARCLITELLQDLKALIKNIIWSCHLSFYWVHRKILRTLPKEHNGNTLDNLIAKNSMYQSCRRSYVDKINDFFRKINSDAMTTWCESTEEGRTPSGWVYRRLRKRKSLFPGFLSLFLMDDTHATRREIIHVVTPSNCIYCQQPSI